MTSGTSDYNIRKATLDDLDAIKHLVDQHKEELGFVIRPALKRSIDSHELYIAESQQKDLIGFVHYRHRLDGQTTLYNIAIDENWHRKGVATRLLDALRQECETKQQDFILLKCPQGLPANVFYEKYGFSRMSVDEGKHRKLLIWRFDVQPGTH